MLIETSSDHFLFDIYYDNNANEETLIKSIESINTNKNKTISVWLDSNYINTLIHILQNTSSPKNLWIINGKISGHEAAQVVDSLRDTNIRSFSLQFDKLYKIEDGFKEFTHAISHSKLKTLGIFGNLNHSLMAQLDVKNFPIDTLHLDGYYQFKTKQYHTLSEESFSKLMSDLPESNIHRLIIGHAALSKEYLAHLDFSNTHITHLKFGKLLYGGIENLNLIGSQVIELSLMDNIFSASELKTLCSNLKGTKVEVLHLEANDISVDGIEAFKKQLVSTNVKIVTFGDKDVIHLDDIIKTDMMVKEKTTLNELSLNDVLSSPSDSHFQSTASTPTTLQPYTMTQDTLQCVLHQPAAEMG